MQYGSSCDQNHVRKKSVASLPITLADRVLLLKLMLVLDKEWHRGYSCDHLISEARGAVQAESLQITMKGLQKRYVWSVSTKPPALLLVRHICCPPPR